MHWSRSEPLQVLVELYSTFPRQDGVKQLDTALPFP